MFRRFFFFSKRNFINKIDYRIDRQKRWTCHVEHKVDHVDRSTYCLDYFQPMRTPFQMEWIGSRAHRFVFSLLFQMTVATGDTNLCRINAMWCFWWCAVGKWIRPFHSNDYRPVPSVAKLRHHCIYQWYRISWYHSLQRKWWHDPIDSNEMQRKKSTNAKQKHTQTNINSINKFSNDAFFEVIL